MNRELSKPIQEALARQAAGDVHPSADALTAFVEHSLPQRESQRVTQHLAQCADCREIVFLASNAVEETVGEEQELTGAAAVRRSGWRRWWVWVPALAAVLVVAGVVLWRAAGFGPSAPMTVAVKAPPPATNAQEASPLGSAAESVGQPAVKYKTTVESQKPAGKLAHAPTNQKQPVASVTESVIARNAPEEYPSAPGAVPKSLSPPPADAFGFAKSPPAVAPTHNAFVESEGQGTSGVLAGARPTMEKPQMAMHSVSASRYQWRVTADGRLERASAPGSWTPVLADQPAAFRVVSVVGNNVWAGGSSGALFHSSDGGQNWSKQPLAGETGAIVSIRFGDAAHGVVTTDGGSQWQTSDGGVTWTKE